MSRTLMSLMVDDVSVLARSLRKRLETADGVPSHVEMLNLIAKSGGYRNIQHLKAEQESSAVVEEPQPAVEINAKRVKKATTYFDLQGRLGSWPKKHSLRMLCLWVLWSRLPARTPMSELEIDERLSLDHTFCDHALLRRMMVDNGMVARTADGREYQRLETQPPAEALEVFKLLH